MPLLSILVSSLPLTLLSFIMNEFWFIVLYLFRLKQMLRQMLTEHHWRDEVKKLATGEFFLYPIIVIVVIILILLIIPIFITETNPNFRLTEKIRNNQGPMTVESLVAAITPEARGKMNGNVVLSSYIYPSSFFSNGT